MGTFSITNDFLRVYIRVKLALPTYLGAWSMTRFSGGSRNFERGFQPKALAEKNPYRNYVIARVAHAQHSNDIHKPTVVCGRIE